MREERGRRGGVFCDHAGCVCVCVCVCECVRNGWLMDWIRITPRRESKLHTSQEHAERSKVRVHLVDAAHKPPVFPLFITECMLQHRVLELEAIGRADQTV